MHHIFLAVQKRDEKATQIIGELFYLMIANMSNVIYWESILILETVMLIQQRIKCSKETLINSYVAQLCLERLQ